MISGRKIMGSSDHEQGTKATSCRSDCFVPSLSHVETWLGPRTMNKTKSFLAVTGHKEALWTPTCPESCLLVYSTFMCGEKNEDLVFSPWTKRVMSDGHSATTATTTKIWTPPTCPKRWPVNQFTLNFVWKKKKSICVLTTRCEG